MRSIGAIGYTFLIVLIQAFLGLPFLLTYPKSYLSKAFEFDRVFFYKWTVNFRFLSEETFVAKKLGYILLASQFIFLLIFFLFKWLKEGNIFAFVFGRVWRRYGRVRELKSEHIVTTMLISNYLGIIFSRTLHYQFYVWYFHSLPYLLLQTQIPPVLRFIILCAIEYCFLVYPSTIFSSALLQTMHIVLLIALLFAPSKDIYELEKKKVQ